MYFLVFGISSWKILENSHWGPETSLHLSLVFVFLGGKRKALRLYYITSLAVLKSPFPSLHGTAAMKMSSQERKCPFALRRGLVSKLLNAGLLDT